MQFHNKIHRTISLNLALLLMASLATFPASVTAASIALASRGVIQDQQPKATDTLERGYRTGYSDGYQSGYGDSADASSRDFRNKEDYQSADRTYSAAHGPRELFRDGYQQGYEAGYETGYERRPFNSTAPANLELRSVSENIENTTITGSSDVATPIPGGRDFVVIPPNTMLLVQLETNMSTNASQPGDRIQARVINPTELEGAMLHGILKSVKRPGRVRGNSLLQVDFEDITLPNGRSAKVDSQIVEVVDGEEKGIGEVDDEGGIHGKDSTKGDVAKVGTGALIGGIIGAIAGGGRGAAIGSTVGGAAGAGSVLSSRGEDVSLRRGDQLRVRTGRTVSIQ